MSLFTLVYRHGARLADEAFFSRVERFALHDPDRGAHVTEAASLAGLGVGRVVSTGHDVTIEEREAVTALAPLSGRLWVRVGARTLTAGPGGLLLFAPNRRDTRVEPEGAGPFSAAALRLAPAELTARLGATAARAWPAAGAGLAFDPARTPAAAALSTRLRTLLDELDRDDGLLAEDRPRRAAAAFLLEGLASLVSATLDDDAAPRPGAAERRRVRAAEAWMAAHYAEIVSVTEVAAAVSVSPRVLQLAFEAVRGHGPRATLAAIRLDAARARLLTSEDSVTSATLACGFSHLGRFAIAYRARFGEAPSETRRRAA